MFRALKKPTRRLIRALGPEASQALVSVGSLFCGPWAAACAAVGNYEVARAHGVDQKQALRGAAVAGASTWAFSPAGGSAAPTMGSASFQLGLNVLAAHNPELGQALMYVFGSWHVQGVGGWARNAVGSYAQYKAQGELARFAARNGLTLQELNLILGLNSKLGLAVAGTTYDSGRGRVEGFLSRDERPGLGVIWYLNDTLLNVQGLLDAVSLSVIANPPANGHLVRHSLGAWRVNNLVRQGYIQSGTLLSLPMFTHEASGTPGVCASRDAICVGRFLSWFRGNTTSPPGESPSSWRVLTINHTIRTVPVYHDTWGE